MSRPKQDGLLYFSLDTNFFFADRRIKRLFSKYGNDGGMIYIYLLTEIYRNKGYYLRWDEEMADDTATDLHLKEGFIEQVMTFLRNRSLLTMRTLATGDTIITSPGIQKRYQAAKKGAKREFEVDSEIWLLSEEETESCIKVTHNVSFSEKNQSKSEKNSIKENKNKNKNKDTIGRFIPPSVEEVSAYCKSRGNGINADEFVDFYSAKGWMIGKNRMKDWKAAIRTWEQRRKDQSPVKKGSFKDFRQNDYDFGKLEEELRSN